MILPLQKRTRIHIEILEIKSIVKSIPFICVEAAPSHPSLPYLVLGRAILPTLKYGKRSFPSNCWKDARYIPEAENEHSGNMQISLLHVCKHMHA